MITDKEKRIEGGPVAANASPMRGDALSKSRPTHGGRHTSFKEKSMYKCNQNNLLYIRKYYIKRLHIFFIVENLVMIIILLDYY